MGYNPKSMRAEEFIDDAEILESIEYAKKNNITILEGIYTTRATVRKGIQYSKFSNLFAEEAIFVITRD